MAIFGRSKKQKEKATAEKRPLQPHSQLRPSTADTSVDVNKSPCQAWLQPYLNDSHASRLLAQGNPPVHPESSLAPYHAYSKVTFSQTYLIPSPQLANKKSRLHNLGVNSVTNLLQADIPACIPGAQIFNEGLPWHLIPGTQHVSQGTSLCDVISLKFDQILTLIDEERFSGNEEDLVIYQPLAEEPKQEPPPKKDSKNTRNPSRGDKISNTVTGTNYFSKVHLYANSKLPPNLPHLKLHMDEYRLLVLAAQSSLRVYYKPTGAERETHINADCRHGTKAMVIKSIPVDDKDVLVFAIRGSQTFMDWRVNLNDAPASPVGFLDDEGNWCHSGFLSVARKMIQPVASRLRKLLREDSSRKHCSLLLTGHSAGGAVAALLYSHMLSTSKSTNSELNSLTKRFKRIHCVTFGAPPVSLLPLKTPPSPSLRNSLFLSFINEGDPVARADKAYLRSLLDLYFSPPPGQSCLQSVTPSKLRPWITGPNNYSETALTTSKKSFRPSPPKSRSTNTVPTMPVWRVPQATLSNAGKLVALRPVEEWQGKSERRKHVRERTEEGVSAQVVTDVQLRGVIWGDPVCHMMSLYEKRIESLGTAAMIGRV